MPPMCPALDCPGWEGWLLRNKSWFCIYWIDEWIQEGQLGCSDLLSCAAESLQYPSQLEVQWAVGEAR